MLNCSAEPSDTSVLKALPGKIDIKEHSLKFLHVLVSFTVPNEYFSVI